MTRSKLESEFEVQLKASGIHYETEFRFHPTRKWRADFYVWRLTGDEGQYFERPRVCALVEVQGVGPQGRHGSWGHHESDCEKFSTAAALGYRVLPVSGKMVKDGTALMLVEAALGLKPLRIAQAARARRTPKASSRTSKAQPGSPRALACLPDRVLSKIDPVWRDSPDSAARAAYVDKIHGVARNPQLAALPSRVRDAAARARRTP